MTVFLRMLSHLLPDSIAFRLTPGKMLTKFFDALSEPLGDARNFADDIHDDLYPATTRELAKWETEFGLLGSGSDADRRNAVAAAWQAQGGQSPRYIQDVLQAAGFGVYVHEWWEVPAADPRVPRNPRTYTTDPTIGVYQCTALASSPPACGGPGVLGAYLTVQPQCDASLANDTKYLVNKDLTRRAPPLIPNDAAAWPFFLYIGAATFGTHASVASARRAELERLVLKLRPSQHWIVMLVDYV